MFGTMNVRTIGKLLLRSVLIFFEALLGCIAIYLLLTVILSRIPVKGETGPKPAYCVYLTSNGVHTDFVMPVRNDVRDWGKQLKLSDEFARDTTRNWISIGWGDKNFFLKTKNWSDLTAGTALKAVFGMGTGAIHIVQRGEPDKSSQEVIALHFTKDQYKRLLSYIDGSFLRKNGRLSRIRRHPYSSLDFFFDSNESYSLAYTCNSWTNSGLKASGQKACLWTAFKGGLFAQYGK